MQQGNVSFNFTTPEALTKMKFALVAHTQRPGKKVLPNATNGDPEE